MGLTLKQVQDLIDWLLQYDINNSSSSYSLIKNCLFTLSIKYPVLSINSGVYFARCRLHLKNEKFFYKIAQISYRQDIMNINDFGRANEPIQSIFYASDKPEISLIETSNIYRNNNVLPSETITMGIWEVKQPIKTAFILSNDIIKGKNKIIEKLTTQFTSIVEQEDTRKTEPHLKFLDFISKQYIRNSNGNSSNYKLSCAFSNYIFSKSWIDPTDGRLKNIDAIVYPSSLDLNGINIAVHPRVIDQRKLILVSARKSIMKKIEGLSYSQDDIVDSKSIDYVNGNILW